jgi:hypothetical protein
VEAVRSAEGVCKGVEEELPPSDLRGIGEQ